MLTLPLALSIIGMQAHGIPGIVALMLTVCVMPFATIKLTVALPVNCPVKKAALNLMVDLLSVRYWMPSTSFTCPAPVIGDPFVLHS